MDLTCHLPADTVVRVNFNSHIMRWITETFPRVIRALKAIGQTPKFPITYNGKGGETFETPLGAIRIAHQVRMEDGLKEYAK